MNRDQAVKNLLERQTAHSKKPIKFKKWVPAFKMANSKQTSFNWLVDGLFPRTGLAVVYGSPDTGKSTLLRQLCLCVVASNHWIGFETKPQHKRTAYISTEDDKESLNVMLPKQVDNMGYDKVHSHNVHFLFQAGDVLKELTTLLETGHKFDLIVIDCFSDIFTLNNSQANQVRVFLSNFHDLARTYETLIIFNHHSKKETENKIPHKNNVSGVGIVSKSRIAIEFRKDPLESHKRHLCVVKGNYLKDDMKEDSFCLDFSSGFHFKFLGKEYSKPFESLVLEPEERENIDENIYNYVEVDKTGTQEKAALHFDKSQTTICRAIKRHKEVLLKRKK